MKTKVAMLSLGCARNLVDAEVILGYLKEAGFVIMEEITEADVAIVNTCCFIREAEEESIDTILNLSQLKEKGGINKIIVCGCLAQRYKNELLNRLKEVDVRQHLDYGGLSTEAQALVDAFVGVGSIDKIVNVVKQVLDNRKNLGIFGRPEFLYSHLSPRVVLTPRYFAYVKISEGCNHHCSYCIIPDLRGRYRSRPIDSILKEADLFFNKRGVNEINLIGQDTTMYGQDLYAQSRLNPLDSRPPKTSGLLRGRHSTGLAGLLLKLSTIAKGKWVRLLYTHPAHFSKELITIIKNELSICKYIDLPIQHINDKILKKMKRGTSRKQILSLIDTLRREIPLLAIRTTLIVGFPGETDAQFKELLDFIRETKFERLGLFRYSRQAGTPAYDFTQQISEKVKQSRYDQALSLQQDICTKINENFLGKELRVLIDEQDMQDKGQYLGRTQYDAPEVDGYVYVKSKKALKAGDFVQVKITDTLEYDLVGEIIRKSL